MKSPELLDDIELTEAVTQVINTLRVHNEEDAIALLHYLYFKCQRLEQGIRKIIEEAERALKECEG